MKKRKIVRKREREREREREEERKKERERKVEKDAGKGVSTSDRATGTDGEKRSAGFGCTEPVGFAVEQMLRSQVSLSLSLSLIRPSPTVS